MANRIQMAQPGNGRREWSDRIGFVFWVSYGLWILFGAHALALLMLPTVLHEIIVGFSFLLRRRRKAQLSSTVARIAAYGGSFLIPVSLGYARATGATWFVPTRSVAMGVTGFALWLLGTLLAVWGVWQLRYAFGIEPQARQLVITGLYRFARHPIYAAYVLQYAGIGLMRFSPPLALILLAWFTLVLLRIHFEEEVLSTAFPEYAEYRERVGMFWPKRWQPAPASARPLPPAREVPTIPARAYRAPAGGLR